jgi:Tol biopolymer transport system component
LIFTEASSATNDDIMELQLDGARSVTPLVNSSFVERNGVVSPDGRWLAYEANDSGGGFEVSVRPFPATNSGQWQVSTTGGTRPLWAPNGDELFYVSPAGALMRVGVGPGTSWTATTPTTLIKEGYFTIPDDSDGRTYDIAADGKRFLMLKQNSSEQSAAPASLIVVLNWFEELKRLVPTN